MYGCKEGYLGSVWCGEELLLSVISSAKQASLCAEITVLFSEGFSIQGEKLVINRGCLFPLAANFEGN